ncbi:hypothetical protein EW146_g6410 [Bondarzewia mesenterica]|uniref:Uncharacterized protein n=1 Tax=Bondarzewia mesenterica TaxID=1095465 RepID=A0A4S4LQQ7_9AGAM|nr:hypothetical protein EW146_g6410 [Bondarzewia mesenterica]
MPSLRRTFSSPSFRSSPYPTSLGNATGRGHGPRRSSGSETSSRRVLADIDWWRVSEGQHDVNAGVNEAEEREVHEHTAEVVLGALVGHAVIASEAVLQRTTTPVVPPDAALGTALVEELSQTHPPSRQFAALAISPRTPVRRHASESSTSSVESTQESPLTPRESLSFDDLGFADLGMDVSSDHMHHFSFATLQSLSFAQYTTFESCKDASRFDDILSDAFIHDDDIFA